MKGTSQVPSARILIVDDKENIRTPLGILLRELGYWADEAESGERALEMTQNTAYDLVVVDIVMPPGMDGIELMHRLSQRDPDLPFIVLTGQATLDYAIQSVRLHAANFLQKPIKNREFAAAVRAGLEQSMHQRRSRQLLCSLKRSLDTLCASEPTSDTAAPLSQRSQFVGNITLDCKSGLVTLDQGGAVKRVELTRSEAAVLSFFMEHPGEVSSCSEIAAGALHYDVDDVEAKSIVRPQVHRLRCKIEPDPAVPCLIVTIRGRGYMFCP